MRTRRHEANQSHDPTRRAGMAGQPEGREITSPSMVGAEQTRRAPPMESRNKADAASAGGGGGRGAALSSSVSVSESVRFPSKTSCGSVAHTWRQRWERTLVRPADGVEFRRRRMSWRSSSGRPLMQ